MKYNITLLLVLVFFLWTCQSEKKTQESKTEPQTIEATEPIVGRFESTIKAYEEADKANRPPEDVIVFSGSSSILMWKSLEEDMKPLKVINRGFGGSTMPELIHYADRIIFPYKPSCIVIYEGDNDIVSDEVSPASVLETLKEYQAKVQATLPGTKTFFIAVKPSISRKHLLDKALTTNQLIADYCKTDSLMEFVDIATPMLEASGNIRSDIFIQDSLHMNARGYEIWTPIVKEALRKYCK